jgi:hypothetical protein
MSADSSDPPPSTTRTRPSAGSARADFTSALSRWQRTVLITPVKEVRPPKCRNCTEQDCSSCPRSSQRSAVETLTPTPP